MNDTLERLNDQCEVNLVGWNGKRLKEIRKRRGYTQSELAVETQIHQSNISRWERDEGRPDVHEVYALADALRVSCEAFRQEVGTEPIKRPGKLNPDD